MLRVAVLPSRDYGGECGLGQAQESRVSGSLNHLSPQLEYYLVAIEHEYLCQSCLLHLPDLLGCFMCLKNQV